MLFKDKLEKILRENRQTLTESEEAYGTNSPTHVKPEKGQEVTSSLDGSGKIDATGPVPTSASTTATLKTTPGVSPTEGPTGHIPGNSDLPRPQLDGLDKDNSSAGKDSLPPKPKVYGLSEEEEDKKEKEEEDKKELPPFMKKKKEVKEESGSEASKTLLGKSKAGEKADHVKEETDQEEGDKTKQQVAKEEKEDDKEDKKTVEEATKALFAGDTISEALREKTAIIFEATLSTRIKEYRQVLNDRYTKKLNSRVETIREELTELVNGNLDLVVEDWSKKNDIPLENAIKSELTEDFIVGLKSLFEEHYIELPSEKINVVTELVDRISKLENKLNEQIQSNVELSKQVKLNERTEVFNKVTKGMIETQVEKLRGLSENVDFKNSTQYETSLVTLKESVGSTKKPETKRTLNEVVETNTEEETLPTDMFTSLKGSMARMAVSAKS
jgi:hypothetical protein